MIKKLQRKFIAVSTFSMLLVLTIIIGIINILNYQKVIQDAKNILYILSENNGSFPKMKPSHEKENNLQPPPKPKDLFHRNISPEMPYESRYFIVILDKEGNIHSTDTSKVAAIDTNTASNYAIQVWKSGKTSGFLSNYRYLQQKMEENTYFIFLDCGRSLSTFRSFLFSSIFVSVLGLISVLILVIIFSKIAMKPISESYEKQRCFITDAGHEIKTPLTIINANTEILEIEYGENEWIQGIRKQTIRLSSLTKDLIYLSRMEEPKNQLQKIDFSISDLLEETIQSFQVLATTQEKSFTTNITPLLSYYGDEASIQQLIFILLDNALKYSTEHGCIDVVLQKKGKNIQLFVYNTVEHITNENISRLFERFYRTDASRNSETGGYGIGLSIARAIVEAHKGKITADTSDGHSLRIAILL